MFEFTTAHLQRLLRIGQYPDPGQYLLFGLRGCLPTNLQDVSRGPVKPLRVTPTDHRHLRCAVGFADRENGTMLICPGSTVPHGDYIRSAVNLGGQGTNQLMPALLRYRKDAHPRAGGNGSHAAFVQDIPFPHQRSADDPNYDNEDAVFVDSPGDNLHAAYVDSTAAEVPARFESKGCVVVAGYPKRIGRPQSRDLGCWPRLRDAAYASGNEIFEFLLTSGAEAEATASSPADTIPVMLRYRSEGELVTLVRERLTELGFLEPQPRHSSVYDRDVLLAAREFQRREGLTADGSCGLYTADALGITPWAMA